MSYKNNKIYKAWYNMIDRCTNPNCKDYHYYGGKGVSVCQRWMSFENFYDDMGTSPDGKELDRIENTKGYEPYNCRWATRSEQNANRSKSKGYYWNKYHQKYEAKTKKDGKRIFLGYFDDPLEAHEAYLKAKDLIHKSDHRPEIVKNQFNIKEAII